MRKSKIDADEKDGIFIICDTKVKAIQLPAKEESMNDEGTSIVSTFFFHPLSHHYYQCDMK